MSVDLEHLVGYDYKRDAYLISGRWVDANFLRWLVKHDGLLVLNCHGEKITATPVGDYGEAMAHVAERLKA